jgi:plastocyanin
MGMSNKQTPWLLLPSFAILVLCVMGCVAVTGKPPVASPALTPSARPTFRTFTRTPIVFPTRSPTPSDGTARIQIGDNFFEPYDVSIRVGMTVEWQHTGSGTHTITSLQGEWQSINPAFGSRNRVSFNTPGVYTYVCAFHSGMGGVIRVGN